MVFATPSLGGHPSKSPPNNLVNSVFHIFGHLPLIVHSKYCSSAVPVISKQLVLSVGFGENLVSLKAPKTTVSLSEAV